MNRAPWWFFAGVAAFLLAVNRMLPASWLHDPSNATGGVAFVIWLIGAVLLTLPSPDRRVAWWAAALIAGLVGELGALAVLRHIALAMLAASLVRGKATAVAVGLGALSWMPAWGWMTHRLSGEDPHVSRIIFCLACLGLAALIRRKAR